MITLGMIPGVEQHTEKQRNVTTAEYLEAETDGLWYPEKKAGETFRKGELLGEVRNIWGELLKEYQALYDGIILYQTVSLGIKEGDPLIAYGAYGES